MERDALSAWFTAYGAAWESRSPDRAAALFTTDAKYYRTPFEAPFEGVDGITGYWAHATGPQANVQFSFDVLAPTETGGIVQWASTFDADGEAVSIDGIAVVTFDANGLCQVFREWWHSREPQ